MPRPTTLKIVEEPNEIDDHLLDIIGNEFRFDHEKGLAEWLKNSVDAYRRADVPDVKQHVILRFVDGEKNDAIFECIDFVGMEETDIVKAFKRWGDPEAAKRGLKKRVYGGHGNGGKFYMRQMFQRSYFVTYKLGYLSIFGFNESRKYGFAQDFKNKKIKPEAALQVAGIDDITFPVEVKKAILSGVCGFTVVRGMGPAGMKNKIRTERIVDKFKNHPQSRRILAHINVWLARNDSREYSLLKPEELKPLPGFEGPRVIPTPDHLTIVEENEKVSVEMANKKYSQGRLILKTSEEAFASGSKSGDLNRIDIVGEIGVIGSYPLYKLGVSTFPQASFIYGECECPILEDPEMDSVKNDRTELVENTRSKALLVWIRDRVDEYANEIATKERSEQEANQKRISAAFNEYLNKWKDQFMHRLIGDLFRAGDDNRDGPDDNKHRRRVLEVPENGFNFSFLAADIVLDEEEQITLKAQVPDPIPIGSIVSIKSTNPHIEVADEKLVIKAEYVKTTLSGETVAVMNLSVTGRKIGEVGKLVANVGKHKAEITLKVIASSGKDKAKKPKSPQVLLSGMSPDPLAIAPDGTVTLTERDPVVYQRYQDVSEGIYWINTQSPLAAAILDRYGDHSTRWRDYLFQRYVDIFVKQGIYELQKRDPDGFRAERIDSDILDVLIKRIHAAAVNDLGRFFFEEEFEPTIPTSKSAESHETSK